MTYRVYPALKKVDDKTLPFSSHEGKGQRFLCEDDEASRYQVPLGHPGFMTGWLFGCLVVSLGCLLVGCFGLVWFGLFVCSLHFIAVVVVCYCSCWWWWWWWWWWT